MGWHARASGQHVLDCSCEWWVMALGMVHVAWPCRPDHCDVLCPETAMVGAATRDRERRARPRARVSVPISKSCAYMMFYIMYLTSLVTRQHFQTRDTRVERGD